MHTAGTRCLGTIRTGGCNLKDRGGKLPRDAHGELICMFATSEKLLTSIIFRKLKNER